MTTPSSTTATRDQVMKGPITRSRAKKLQQQVNSLLTTFNASIDENFILPKYSTYILLRFLQEQVAAGPKEASYREAEPLHCFLTSEQSSKSHAHQVVKILHA
jgi:hypothetical protein